MRFVSPFLLCVSLPALMACGSSGNKQAEIRKDSVETPAVAAPVQKDTFPAGQVIPSVICWADTSQSYALYLPKSMKAGKQYPVVIFFDAHARGKLPLKKYAALADRYGFILVCSNNSKNSTEQEKLQMIKARLFDDVLQRVPVDRNNIFAGGFSGGARVAIMISAQDESVKGILANSASFDPVQQPLRAGLAFIGLVGDEDFNYAEVKGTEADFGTATNTHDLEVFEGKHDWAPETSMRKAFSLLYLEAVRSNRLAKNDSLVQSDFETDDKQARKLLASEKNKLRQAEICKRMQVFYHDLVPVDYYKNMQTNIQADPSFAKAKADDHDKDLKEQAEEEAYRKDMRMDMGWWKAEVGRLNKEIKGSPDKELRKHDKRLLGAMSLIAFMAANGSVRHEGEPSPNTQKYLDLYQLVDPENSEWAFLSAIYAMRKNDTATALEKLKVAVRLGFEEPERIDRTAEFNPLRDNVQFKALLEQIRKKARE